MKLKFIKNYENRYAISDEGKVYSYCIMGSKIGKVSGTIQRELKAHSGKTSPYLMVGLSNKDGTINNALVHRLVAEAFIPNINNYPEVDHIDSNPYNNRVENLRWVTRQQNIDHTLENHTAKRNYKCTKLSYNNKVVGYFESELAACKYASKLGASKSSLQKYKKTRGWVIESVSTIPQGSSFLDENGSEVVPEFGIKN